MLMKKLSIARNQLKKSTGEIPIKWGRYINKEMQEQKVFFFGHEKAIYGSDGDRLDEKLIKIEDGISDAFTESKDYAIGDYCIYLNSLYRFTTAKSAGAWDGAAVVPVSIAGEIGGIKSQIDGINSGFVLSGLIRARFEYFDQRMLFHMYTDSLSDGVRLDFNLKTKAAYIIPLVDGALIQSEGFTILGK